MLRRIIRLETYLEEEKLWRGEFEGSRRSL